MLQSINSFRDIQNLAINNIYIYMFLRKFMMRGLVGRYHHIIEGDCHAKDQAEAFAADVGYCMWIRCELSTHSGRYGGEMAIGLFSHTL